MDTFEESGTIKVVLFDQVDQTFKGGLLDMYS